MKDQRVWNSVAAFLIAVANGPCHYRPVGLHVVLRCNGLDDGAGAGTLVCVLGVN